MRLYEDWFRRSCSAIESHEDGRRKGRAKNGLLGATIDAVMVEGTRIDPVDTDGCDRWYNEFEAVGLSKGRLQKDLADRSI